MYSRLYY